MADEPETVESLRIKHLEEEIARLREGTRTLNIAQVKQLYWYVGLPVAIASGILGVAAWFAVERFARDEAEDKAGETAARIAAETAEEVAASAAVAPAEAAARTAAGEVAERIAQSAADDARDAAREAAEKESGRVAELVAQRTARETAAIVRAASVADELMRRTAFTEEVSAGALSALEGAVVAFAGDCPEELGWVPYEEGAGKFLIGAGNGTLRYTDTPHRPEGAPAVVALTPLKAEDQGGEERHELTEAEMPRHDHEVTDEKHDHKSGWISDGEKGDDWGWIGIPGTHGNDRLDQNSSDVSVDHAGGIDGDTSPHNNMPPFIALNFCRKT